MTNGLLGTFDPTLLPNGIYKVKLPEDPPPIFVQITAPAGDIDLTEPTNIIGTVASDYLFFWDLRYFRVGRHGRGWVTFASGTEAVTNGFLGTFDSTLLPNGIYKVKLVAVDFVGNATETEPLLLKIGEGPKVGHFTLAFTDLEIPVPACRSRSRAVTTAAPLSRGISARAGSWMSVR